MNEPKGVWAQMRAYVDGVEIDRIPELAGVCAMEDWLRGLLDWAAERPGELEVDVITLMDAPSAEEAPVLEVWIGGAPPLRARELGGVLKTFRCGPPRAGGGDPHA